MPASWNRKGDKETRREGDKERRAKEETRRRGDKETERTEWYTEQRSNGGRTE
jgi:hypothetical protein